MHLGQKRAAKLEIPSPALSSQDIFVERIESLDGLISLIEIQIQEIVNLRHSLNSDLLSGVRQFSDVPEELV